MAYIGSSPTKVVSRQSANIFTYTATANQTAFTGTDANGNTLACTPSDIMVHMNGLRLEESDFTATTTTVTLGSGAAAGDEVTITAFVTFETADAYTKSASDARYVNTAGDTMTGTLVAGTRLQVGDSSITQGYPQANFGYVADFQATTGSQTFISIAPPNVSSLGDNGTVIGEDGSDTYITQRNNKNIKLGTSNVNRLIIDGSGRVTMPHLPFFSAHTTSSADITTQSTIVYGATSRNTGSHYSTSNGRFTAPVDGVYSFSVYHWHKTNTAGDAYLYFYLNGSSLLAEFRNTRGSSHSEYQRVGFIQNFYLNANDYVTVQASGSSGGVLHTSSGAPYSYFSGYLIG